ncbi:MAG: Bro-N domain-containing protein [Eubacteriales bacterium]|nr:Bro-N domain-containing protein [Eubacteriales bacterium]
MNNELTTFNNSEFGEIRSISIGNEPWFVGKDVAKALGYKDPYNAVKAHVEKEDKQNWRNTSFKSNRGMTIINESGLYCLILSSTLPAAKQFKRWITSEVLPSIRKTGQYIVDSPQRTEQMLLNMQQQITAIHAKLDAAVPALPDNSAAQGLFLSIRQRKENMRILNDLLNELVECSSIPRNTLLHQLYIRLENCMDVSLDAYLSVYQSETQDYKSRPIHVIAAHEELFDTAKELLYDAIERQQVFT